MDHPHGALFVLGAPRSGTTALYRALALHPEAAWVNNWLRRAPAIAALSAMNRLAPALPTRRRRVWFGADGGTAYRYGQRRGLLERLFPQPVEGEPLFERHGVLPLVDPGAAGRATAAQRRLAPDLDRLCRWGGGRVVISKRIGHNRRVALLHDIVPTARFVVITRDGRAVASSLCQVDWWGDATMWWRRPEDATTEPLELAARHWVEEVTAIERGLATVPAEQVRRIRYEDLVADPWPTLRDVAEFAGLGPDDRWRRDVAAVRFPDRNQGWRRRSRAEVDLLTTVQRPELLARGYL